MQTDQTVRWGERIAQGIGIFLVLSVLLAIFPGWATVWSLLSSQNAAGWAQAFGAIAAIAVTAFLAGSQERRRMQYANRRAAQIAKNARASLLKFHELQPYKLAIELLSPDDLAVACLAKASVLDEHLFDARALPTEALSHEWIDGISAVRQFILQCAVELRETAKGLQDPRRDSYSNKAWKRRLENSLDMKLEELKHMLDLAGVPKH